MQGDTSLRQVALVFTGDEFNDGLPLIEKTLRKAKVKGAFFVTGRFLEYKNSARLVQRLIQEGHYVGPHSDAHLLYAPWENRDSLLVNKEVFVTDLNANVSKIKALGMKDMTLFIPPYEWYNKDIVDWSAELGFTVYNFTPGLRTAADYTYPEMGSRYMSSDRLLRQLFDFEEDRSLNGFVILIHIGTDSRREDKFYKKLGEIISKLEGKNYKFVVLDKI